uniref:Uncharacterized protein n=1 Tax=Arion vulgaris TaxID=1028688 RepID=A0A0B7AWP8_9EUPU
MEGGMPGKRKITEKMNSGCFGMTAAHLAYEREINFEGLVGWQSYAKYNLFDNDIFAASLFFKLPDITTILNVHI